ncbi:gamma-glutamylcyclotransferase, partial [Halobacillus sp. BBL2006]|uniref:gamma-glutamylcyclotransferase n=1 Tax=Halobacillus sp. BBL2006 TaxID=1543706 RepID=UPI00068A8F68
MKVFVYGSLCKNLENHHYLKNSKLISEQAWVYGELFSDSSYYPVLIKNTYSKTFGELYEVDEATLEKLDRLEGFSEHDPNSLFLREKTTVFSLNQTTEAYTYFYPHKPAGAPVPHGNWKVARMIKKDKLHYFAFGSCMDNERFRTGKVDHLFQNVLGCGTLSGYDLTFSHHTPDGGRADIVEDELGKRKVEGLVYEVSQEALKYLYQREGVYREGYRPVVVDVQLKDQPLISA